jgi:hypothetical protein
MSAFVQGIPTFAPFPTFEFVVVASGRAIAGAELLAQPVLADRKRWWLKPWSPVEGHPKKR